MKAPSSRRSLLAGLATVPFVAAPVAASLADMSAGPSDLAQACEWAADLWLAMPARSDAEGWDDARLDAEMDRYGAVCIRATIEPSRNLSDLRAKARLGLIDFERELFPFTVPEKNREPSEAERLILTILRELIATGGSA